MTRRAAAVAYAVMMGCLFVFQICLVLGAPWGAYTQGGYNEGVLPTPARVFAAVSLIIVLVLTLGVLALNGMGPFTNWSPRALSRLRWFTLAYGALAIPMNLISQSVRERLIWTPFAVIVFALLWRAQPPRIPQAN